MLGNKTQNKKNQIRIGFYYKFPEGENQRLVPKGETPSPNLELSINQTITHSILMA